MADATMADRKTVNTVLGPVPADELGVVAVHEALLSVVPGAQYAPDISIDRAEVFETLAAKLTDFREHGGTTIVDSTGMFHGRDLTLYEALSRATGVHIVASTGMGPEEMLGGYFLTPQTNPPTPWPAEKFADLFSKEVTEGMVVPRVERRAAAGLVTTTAARDGMTATEESLFRGSARTALKRASPVSIRYGADALHDLDIVLDEQLPAGRVLVGDLDRRDAVANGVSPRGRPPGRLRRHRPRRPERRRRLRRRPRARRPRRRAIEAGHRDRILLSSNAIGVAKGQPDSEVAFSHVLSAFVPLLASLGVSEEDVRRILIENPRDLLTVR